jgi:murein hydrolase activator
VPSCFRPWAWPLAVAVALLVPWAAVPAQSPPTAQERAQEEARAERELERVRSELRELALAQQQLQGQRTSASQALREVDAAVGAAVRGLRDTEAGIATQEARLRELETEADALEARLSGQREALAALVRSAYALGRHEQLKLLLAQDRISDLARVMAYHRYVQEDRSERIRGLLDELQVLAELSVQVRERREALAASRLRQQEQLAELESQRGERAGVVAELESRHQAGAERIAALGRDEAALGKLLEDLRDVLADVPRQLADATPLADRRGQLPWPLDGARLVGFGGRMPDGRAAQGWLIAGTAGAEVRAISHGQVAFADWLKGYGLIVIVDHGDGWMSLYANNDALLKDAGDWVRAREPVATVGSSGAQGRPALYFELRRESRPVDPATWLQRR